MADITMQPLVVTLSGELPFKRQMVFQTGLDADASQADINAMLDKMRVAFERQFAFGEIEVHKLELAQQEKLAREHSVRIAQVDKNVNRDWEKNGRRGEVRLTHAEQKQKDQAYEIAESIKERIAKVRGDMAACEAKIAG